MTVFIPVGWNFNFVNDRFISFFTFSDLKNIYHCVYVVVKFLFQVIFVFLLFFGMVMYANEVETKEK